MGVPDSRNMLCIEPYECPVDATSERMLAPLSYWLRSSLTNWSLFLLSFFTDASRDLFPPGTHRRKP